MKNEPKPYNRQQGLTLIEILVAALILGIGLLGLAGLQSTSLKSSDNAYLRSQATFFAYNIIDSMRANHDAVVDGEYDFSIGDTVPTQDCIGTGASCMPAEMAEANLQTWLIRIHNTLPNGKAQIETTNAGSKTAVTICIQWIARPIVDDNSKNTNCKGEKTTDPVQKIAIKTLI